MTMFAGVLVAATRIWPAPAGVPFGALSFAPFAVAPRAPTLSDSRALPPSQGATTMSVALSCGASAPRSVAPERSSIGRDFSAVPPSRRTLTATDRTGLPAPYTKTGSATEFRTLVAMALLVQPLAADGHAAPGVALPEVPAFSPSNQSVRVVVLRQ